VPAITKLSVSKPYYTAWTECGYLVLAYKSGFVEGFRRWRGYILAP